MYRRYSSVDRLTTCRSEAMSRSPYAKNYRTNLTHEQRELLSHRQSVAKLPRRELEDRYIALVDEHFAVKKDNALNNEKIKKMATKLLRLSAEGKSRGSPFPMQLSPNEHLEIQIIRLEAYNALLKERLHIIIRKYTACVRSGSNPASVIRRPASCSNLSVKRKIALSEEDMHLLEIPEPPEIVFKSSDCRSNCGSSTVSGIAKSSPRKSTAKSSAPAQQHSQHASHPSSTIYEIDNESNPPEMFIETPASTEQNSTRNDLKNTIQKLEFELSEAKREIDALRRVNATLEEKLTNEMVSKRITENVELIEIRKTMGECEMELNDLRQQYVELQRKTDSELNEANHKLSDLKENANIEAEKGRKLAEELAVFKTTLQAVEEIQDETEKIQVKNKALSAKQSVIESKQTSNDNAKDDLDLIEENEQLSHSLNEATEKINEVEVNLQAKQKENEEIRAKNEKLTEELIALKRSRKDKKEVTLKSDEETEKVENPSTIPLEPNVIISSKTEGSRQEPKLKRQRPKTARINRSALKAQTPMSSDHSNVATTTSSANTFVVPATNNEHSVAIHVNRRSDETASEISSIDSDENFRSFQRKNRKLQSSLLLSDANSVPIDFSQRLQLLERAAFYRPLANKASECGDDHFLICNCPDIDGEKNIQAFHEEIQRAVANAKILLLKELKTLSNGATANGNDSSEGLKYSSLDDSSECRELLRVQYNLNNLYKQELELMCKTCKNQTEQFLSEIDVMRAKIRSYEDKIRELENVTTHETTIGSRMLEVGTEQGTFELHVDALKPTKEGRAFLSCKHGKYGAFYVSWTFFNSENETRTSIRSSGPSFTFRSTNIYLVTINETFLRKLQKEKLSLKLFASIDNEDCLIGTTAVDVSEVLAFPQNKIQITAKVISSSNERTGLQRVDSSEHKHLANLYLWCRLTCDIEILKEYSVKSVTKRELRPSETEKSLENSPRPTDGRVKVPTEAKKTVSHGVSMTVRKFKMSSLNEFPRDQNIYVAYSFLGHRHLRSAAHKATDETIEFDFKHTFDVVSDASRDRARLLKMLQDNERSIKFNLIHENGSGDADISVDSREIGFGLLHLGRQIRKCVENIETKSFEIPVLSKQPPYQNIGSLEITIDGINEMKIIQSTSSH